MICRSARARGDSGGDSDATLVASKRCRTEVFGARGGHVRGFSPAVQDSALQAIPVNACLTPLEPKKDEAPRFAVGDAVDPNGGTE